MIHQPGRKVAAKTHRVCPADFAQCMYWAWTSTPLARVSSTAEAYIGKDGHNTCPTPLTCRSRSSKGCRSARLSGTVKFLCPFQTTGGIPLRGGPRR